MEEILTDIYNYIMYLITSSQIFGPLLACLLVFLESILPVLPLFVFITIIFISYGYVFGFIISYLLTCLGCLLAFYIFRHLLKNYFKNNIRKINTLDNLMKIIDKLSLSNLVILMVIPFTPAFLINIAAALSELKFSKFLVAVLISKISLVFFWGFIGTSLLHSLKNPKIIIIVFLMIGVSCLVSKVIAKRLKIK